VIAECREHAMRTPETYGIWGATTPRERAGSIAAKHDLPAAGR
jgi:WhiB family redox-sensing transcriptional regulator